MREYIKQFYNEGLATTFYLKPIRYVDKKIKNKKISKVISFIIKIIYTILVIMFSVYVFLRKLPI